MSLLWKEVVLETAELGKEVTLSGNESPVCNRLITEVTNSPEQLSVLKYVTSPQIFIE